MDRMTKFILLLIFEIPAIILSIIILAHFALNRQDRSKLKNHGWIVLLIANFLQLVLDLPMGMSYFHRAHIWPESNAYCRWWIWCDFSLNSIGLFLMAWISLERHLLIFHSHTILQVRWKKWAFHFIPIILCLMWPLLIFFVLVVINPFCIDEWDFSSFECGIPCYFTINILVQFDFIFDLVFPIIIIMFANLTLVIRVIHQKMSQQQGINWRRHRKMVLQLWIISSLYIGFWSPVTIAQLIQMTVMPSFMIDQLETMQFVVYFIPLFLPMICLSTLPELVKKITNIIATQRMNVIGVITFNRGANPTVTIVTGR